MPLILNLDSSTSICSVALASDGALLGKKESHAEKSHARLLAVFVDELLKENGLQVPGLDAVAVSMGPGSYTGLRIGVSTAKGLAYGSGIPLIGISTLDALVSGSLRNKEVIKLLKLDPTTLLCPMIDARRAEVYTALYSSNGENLEAVSARIITEESYLEKLEESGIVFFGNGAEKCRTLISHPNSRFVSGIETSAENMIELAENSCLEKNFEDVAYFEPFYLKDFVATIPKNKFIPGSKIKKGSE